MSYAIFQMLVVSAIVAWSAAFAARKWFPRSSRAVQASLARRLGASGHAWLRALGAKLTPQQVAGGSGCGSAGGCSSCGACAPRTTAASDGTRPLTWRPRARH